MGLRWIKNEGSACTASRMMASLVYPPIIFHSLGVTFHQQHIANVCLTVSVSICLPVCLATTLLNKSLICLVYLSDLAYQTFQI
jgi:hypothetical protein